MNVGAVAAALRLLAEAIEATPEPPKRRPRGRPRKAPPVATSSDAAVLAAMGVKLEPYVGRSK